MAIVGTRIFILHQSPLQVRIWQKILQSQNLSAIPLPVSTNLLQQIADLETKGMSLPDLILLAEDLPNFNVEGCCQLLQNRPEPIPVILLANQMQKISTLNRQQAIGIGAADILPQFDPETFAIEAVNALKAITKIVEGIDLNNNELIQCLMSLKRDLANNAPIRTAAVSSARTTAAKKIEVDAESNTTESAEVDAPQPSQKRIYRGRSY
ncbi:MAG: hypothetical protein WBB82_08200 [Limnothrix sp.]